MRRTLAVIALLLPALVVGLLGPASPADATSLARPGRYAIGDSVMLGAKVNLRYRHFTVNAVQNRQFSAAVALVRAKAADGTLPRNVVVALGTNGYIRLSDCKSLVAAAGWGRRVFLVTNRVPRAWEAQNNRTLRACDAYFFRTRVWVIDWYAYSAGHSSWFYSDRIHLTTTGRSAYARRIAASVDAVGL